MGEGNRMLCSEENRRRLKTTGMAYRYSAVSGFSNNVVAIFEVYYYD